MPALAAPDGYAPLEAGEPFEAPLAQQWDAVKDLDRFLTDLYQYYYEGGHRAVCCNIVVHLLALTFTMGFSFVLFFLVNWSEILSCTGDDCAKVAVFRGFPFATLTGFQGLVLCCFVVFGGFWALNVYYAHQRIQGAADIRAFFHDKLGIKRDSVLQAMTWHQVVTRVIKQQEHAAFCIVQERLTSLEIANVITREDNWLVTFTNLNILTETLPWFVPQRIIYSKFVLFIVRWLIFGWMYDRRSRIQHDFITNPPQLAQRFRRAGLVNLFLVVPALLFASIYVVMRHAEEFRTSKSSMNLQWTTLAEWRFRGFNELPHAFQTRMAAALKEMETFAEKSTGSHTAVSSVKRVVKYVVGAVLAALLVIVLIDDTKLFYLHVRGRSLWWYVPVLGVIFTMASSDVGSHEPCYPHTEYMSLMRLVRHTHYFPPAWRALTGDRCPVEAAAQYPKLRRTFVRDHYRHRALILADEMLGVLLAPLLLIFHFPSLAPRICGIVADNSYASDALGDWCVHGLLDVAPSDEQLATPPVGGKLERSALAFLLSSRAPEGEPEEVARPEDSAELQRIAGYPQSVVELLRRVEVFQRETCAPNPDAWPPELRRTLRIADGATLPDPEDAWGPHFFWLDHQHHQERPPDMLEVEPPDPSCSVQ